MTACHESGCDCLESEAPCGCKWYADGTVYKCLSHREVRDDTLEDRVARLEAWAEGAISWADDLMERVESSG